jgi:hypothetical protein
MSCAIATTRGVTCIKVDDVSPRMSFHAAGFPFIMAASSHARDIAADDRCSRSASCWRNSSRSG